MFKKISGICFTVIFLIMLFVPLLLTNTSSGKISQAEKRRLAAKPHLHSGDGSINVDFTKDFDTWINDNIGFRSNMVIGNAKIMFNGFNILANNSYMYLGPHGELDYLTKDMLKDYQHLDLKSETKLNEIKDSYQTFSDYLTNQGIQFYYFQCWDKQSIYPEQFPTSIKQYGNISKTDQIVDSLSKTNINLISPKKELIDNKSKYDTYSTWGDPTHWTKRGSFIAYQKLMETINSKNNNKYKVLKENDFDIKMTDQGQYVFGGIHKKCMLEQFTIKEPKAYKTKEAPVYVCQWGENYRNILKNDSTNNKDTVLIIGDSYFDSFLYEYFGESFSRTVQVWGGNDQNIKKLIETYHPAIVINENAERCDRTESMIKAANIIKGYNK